MHHVFATLIVLLALAAPVAAERPHPFHVPQPTEGTDFLVVIEIPAGSTTKYEIDASSGHLVVDRLQSMPVVYPANYGSIPSTKGADGDPLDALVITREPIVPGALIKVRAIGVLNMLDGGENDDKIITVPASAVDPQYDSVRTINDLAQIERQRIEAFFRVYKQLPAGRKSVELDGFGDADTATGIVAAGMEAYRDSRRGDEVVP